MTYMLFSLLAVYSIGIIVPFCCPRNPQWQNYVAHGFGCGGSGAGIILGLLGLLAPQPLVVTFHSSIPFLTFGLNLDPLAAFFVLTISLVGLAVSIYALGYVREYYGKIPLGLLGSLYNAFLLSMILVILADNAFFFLIVWEVMSVVSYFLVVTEHEKDGVPYAGLFYLVMTHVGTAFIFVTFLLLFQGAGSFSFESFRQAGPALSVQLQTIVFLAALIGFGAKAGIVPLHVWLPYAHPAAPSHVSALMSGVMIKTAIYALIRVYFDFLGGEFVWWWGMVVLIIGTASAVLGVMYALMEHDIKSLLAFHSVENIGIILMGLGAGMMFLTYDLKEFAALGMLAGLYHTINHAIFKGLLFLGAGSLLYATHTRNMEEYGGLLRRMPWTGLFFLIGAVSISALPPTNGFVSEWLIFQDLFLGFHLPTVLLEMLFPIAAALLALTGALALACFAKAFGISFLAKPRSSHSRHAVEVPLPMRIGMGTLATLCVVLGLGPMVVVPLLDRVIEPFLGIAVSQKILALDGWALTPVDLDFSSLSTPVLAMMLFILAGLGGLVALAFGRSIKSRSYKTWGCGLNLTARMEYTATGFAQPIKRVFSTIYQPTVKLETDVLEESRYFAKHKHFEFHIRPIFQEYLYDPVIRFFSFIGHSLQTISVGNAPLNLYLGYIFVTLLVLLLFTR